MNEFLLEIKELYNVDGTYSKSNQQMILDISFMEKPKQQLFLEEYPQVLSKYMKGMPTFYVKIKR